MNLRALFLTPLLAALLAACDLPGQDTAQGQPPAQTQQSQTQQSQPQQNQVSSRDPQSGLRWIDATELPREGAQLLQTIAQDGKLRYSKDGVTFGNRERLLPRQSGSYYREYTVPTPGENDRGARRIVCGGQPVTSTAECYYTADHYASFKRIRP
ncbi:ribonuclease domain-containing protein [Deinococcus frigens]|uniref:ribonuclease domain-containing protein n=1 Tax=Deinococcus frigens TaxID=249403 RepID=UPI000497C759|nr:ribonuclease domain-containing protein [Deinococcus frigens]